MQFTLKPVTVIAWDGQNTEQIRTTINQTYADRGIILEAVPGMDTPGMVALMDSNTMTYVYLYPDTSVMLALEGPRVVSAAHIAAWYDMVAP